jgi:hypothetical protein
VLIWKGPEGEVPIVKRGNRYLEHETGKALPVQPGTTRPMSVLAAPHPETGKLVPLTADYDMLAVGAKTDVQMPKFRNDEGFIDEVESRVAERMNGAAQRAGYEGGNLVHHGPESQYTGSPGIFGNDPNLTVVDPEKGLLTIPKCGRECMETWCRTTGQCGGLSLCTGDRPRPPCMMIDPDRLVKDYMNDARLRGYTTLRPNAAWDWGEYNGLAGWSPKVVLDSTGAKPADWVYGQYVVKLGVTQVKRRVERALSQLTVRNLKNVALEATQKLFSCPGEPVPGTAQ